ncbi:MAG: twin-arginine translocase TatA/TatE family subunit [Bdellovibrionota bacterium]
MFDIGFSEMLLLAAIALIAIGPKQLPEVARTVGRLLNDLKRATGDLTKTVIDARDSTNEIFTGLKSPFEETAQTIQHTFIEPVKIESGHHQDQPHLDEPVAMPDMPTPEPEEEQLSLLDQPTPTKKET